jgi:hypothetical protein
LSSASGLREGIALLLAQFLSPLTHRLHANLERPALEIGQSERKDRGKGRDSGKRRHEKLAIEKETPITKVHHVCAR